MINLKVFRNANGLTQEELGDFLGIKKSFISKIEHGGAKLSAEKFAKLLENNKGWDTSMLTIEETTRGGDNIHQKGGHGNIGKIVGEAAEVLALMKEVEMLRAQIDELRAQNEKYWNMIEKLTEK